MSNYKEAEREQVLKDFGVCELGLADAYNFRHGTTYSAPLPFRLNQAARDAMVSQRNQERAAKEKKIMEAKFRV